MKITGKTRITFILADPVAHIIGSDVLNRSFAALGRDVVCVPLHVPPGALAHVMQSVRQMPNVAGFGCTIPHKAAALTLVDDLTPEARRIGAVNFVRRNADGSLTGHNIDGAGFAAGLAGAGVSVAGQRVLQVGAGGVGRAIAFALAEGGAAELVITNRDAAKAAALAAAVSAAFPACRVQGIAQRAMPSPEGFGLVANATSLGMKPDDPMPFDATRLRAGTVVAEVIMTPALTPILAEAARRGCITVPGLAMMEPQPRLVVEFMGL